VARLPARRDLGYLAHPQGHEPVLDGRFRADRESGRLQAFNHLDKADTFSVDHTVEEADVLHGRTITSWPSLRTDIRNAGGTWVDEEVVVDEGLVSSRNPDDLDRRAPPRPRLHSDRLTFPARPGQPWGEWPHRTRLGDRPQG
jgi:hypothetical protein